MAGHGIKAVGRTTTPRPRTPSPDEGCRPGGVQLTPPAAARRRVASPPRVLRSKWCPLVGALHSDSVVALQGVLQVDPLAALSPACGGEEPLALAAVRSGCSPQILALLLQHGASVDATDGTKLTALATVAQVEEVLLPALPPIGGDAATSAGGRAAMLKPCLRMPGSHRVFATKEASEERCCAYAAVLLSFGADPRWPDSTGVAAADRAERNGRPRLANLIRHWGGEQVRLVHNLRSRGGARCRPCCRQGSAASPMPRGRRACLLSIPDVAFGRVCEMLAPGVPALPTTQPWCAPAAAAVLDGV
uniref:Uncharacterized protein n=1 Tax=Pyrodinium bahamense TaxID=73915 RepID=A0A7S0B9F5_9DINO